MENGVLFQYFEWNLPNDGCLWRQLMEDADHLHSKGVTAVWIPPAYKADEQDDEGYATYDLFDFGEFDQKGTVRTKYGTRAELERAIKALHDNDIQVILDVVFNHKAGGDYPEKFPAIPVAGDDRLKDIGEEREIEAFTGYDFKGRGKKYSSFKWHWYHFSGVDYDNLSGDNEIFRSVGPGKGWSQGVDTENGNYDFLMCNDLDVDNPDVRKELMKWGRWATKSFGFDGFRMDAMKHIDRTFARSFFNRMRKLRGQEFYFVSEYWSEDIDVLAKYLKDVGNKTNLFDVPLHFNFYNAAEQGADFDMSTLLNGSIVEYDSRFAVTFVDNHDSQSTSSLASNVDDWFKPLAYGLILLMKEGYPVVFYGDYYSVSHDETEEEKAAEADGEEFEKTEDGKIREASPHRKIIDILLDARMHYAFGDQTLYFDHPSTVGLTRTGDDEHPDSGLALLMSNDEDGEKNMCVGNRHAGETWHDLTGSIEENVTIDENGCADFKVKGRNLAVWIKSNI